MIKPPKPANANTAVAVTGITRGRYSVDAIRALAALPVLIFHAYQYSRYGPDAAWPLDGVWHQVLMAFPLGVDLFFVLSAFLLGLPYAAAALGSGPHRSARLVLLRRAARLLPLYYITVLLVWGFTNPTLPGDWLDLLLHMTFTHVYSDEKIFFSNGPAWSLAVEMHFYLLLVVIGTIAQRRVPRLGSRRARLAALYGGIAVLIVISNAYRFWAVYVAKADYEQWSYWFNPLVKLDVFAIGLAFAVLIADGRRPRTKRARYGIGLLGAVVIVADALTQPVGTPISSWWHPVFALGAMLLITASAINDADSAPAILRWRPLVWTGVISYSLYLWQEPMLRLLDSSGLLPTPGQPHTFPVASIVLTAVSLLVAWVSFWLIEQTGPKILAAFDQEGRRRDYYAES